LVESHKGKESPNKGRKASAETIEKLRVSHLGKISNRAGVPHSPESIEKMRLRKIGKKASEETKRKRSNSLRGHVVSKETRAKLSKTHTELWKAPGHASKMGKAWRICPNKPETLVLGLLEEGFPGQWKYTGDFSFTINGKAPDFTNCNGQKKVIEVFGDYWHRGENEDDRAAIFAPFGYETLVVWECELKNLDLVKARIERFCAYENI